MRFSNLVILCAMCAAPQLAYAIGPEIVAVIEHDPTLQIVIAPGGDLPALKDVRVEITDSYAEATAVTQLVDSGIPVATAIAVDTSGSMSRTFPQVQAALRTFVDGMKGGDVVLITNFDEEVEGLEAAWQQADGKAALLSHIDEMKADGNFTHLYEGLNGVVDRLVSDSSAYPLRTVLVLSDGADTGSADGKTLDRARTNALENKIRVNSVGYVPTKSDSTRILQDLASDTHGTYKLADDADAIERLFGEVQKSAHEWIVVTVDTEDIPAGVHELRVKIGPEGDPVVATYALDLKRRFEGKDLKGNDPVDHTMLYVGAASGAALLGIGALFLTVRARRRREAVIAANVARQVDEAKDAARRAAEEARAIRPTISRMMTADGMIDFFAPDSFGTRVVGSDPDSADLLIIHESVSRAHASVERRQDDPSGLYVTDLGSSNGTYHQGLDLRGRGTVRVGNRERLQFGLFAGLVDISEV